MLKLMLWIIGIYIALSYIWGGYVAWRLYKIRKLMNERPAIEFGQLEDNEVMSEQVSLEGDGAQDIAEEAGELWGQGGDVQSNEEQQDLAEDDNEASEAA